MKNICFVFLCIVSILTISACTDNTATPEITGNVTIVIDNQTAYNTSDYFVRASIVFLESDTETFIDFAESDVSNGGQVEFEPVRLNYGNYYVRYQFVLEGSPFGSLKHKPFQVQAGEEVVVKIVR